MKGERWGKEMQETISLKQHVHTFSTGKSRLRLKSLGSVLAWLRKSSSSFTVIGTSHYQRNIMLAVGLRHAATGRQFKINERIGVDFLITCKFL